MEFVWCDMTSDSLLSIACYSSLLSTYTHTPSDVLQVLPFAAFNIRPAFQTDRCKLQFETRFSRPTFSVISFTIMMRTDSSEFLRRG